ncbi:MULTISPECIES: N-acetylmuramoyl-L-alanine amidase [Gammaproteobacteria]|uniref:N-acetylmuramoyl-L-alanine amidase n=1 Tax=Gammaproteobacteria TaxID=1236 RepID=UPI000DD051B5|nr:MULTISPECIES: N-acetylmuramoyl-L-alanine amidase [Gammaproteobacteria]RTE86434.1 AMIN domain-containing protein [Aliidiomarina sp. B3213]TCZ91010.1 AMIN domain-containing protein [Lysobacter sp. N42]
MIRAIYSQSCIIIFLLLSCVWVAEASANTIHDVRVGVHQDKTRVVFELGANPDYTYFTLYDGGPHRVVIDFNETSYNFALTSITTNSLLLERIRPSTPPESSTSRVVLDVNQPIEPNIQVLEPNGDGNYRLVVDLPGQSVIPERSQRVVRTAEHSELRPVVIAVDAGHGGRDPGSVGPTGKYEKHVTLAVAKYLADLIDADPSMEAVLTRTGDYGVSLAQRARLIRQAHADFVISVHADAFTSPEPRGASIWTLSPRRANTEFGRALEDRERLSDELFELDEAAQRESDPYLVETLLDMRRKDSMSDGQRAAETILERLSRVTDLHRREPQGASLAVLSNIGTPSVLVELGFISNPQKERMLTSRDHQRVLARSLYEGIRANFILYPIEGTILANQRIHTHVVESGESLSVIAAQYNTSVAAIMQHNGLADSMLRVGQELQIPAS